MVNLQGNVIIIVLLSGLTTLVAAKEYREYNERFEKRVQEIGQAVHQSWNDAWLRHLEWKSVDRVQMRSEVCKELFPEVSKLTGGLSDPKYYECIHDAKTYDNPKLEQIQKDYKADWDKWWADNPSKSNDDIRQEILDGKWDNWK